MTTRSVVNRAWRSSFVALGVLSAVASVFFFTKVRENTALIDEFVRASTRDVSPADTEAVAVALARAIYRHTDRELAPSNLPLYERLESTSFFNTTSAVSLKRGAYGVFGDSHIGRCGTMTRVTLEALHHLGIPARKLQLIGDESGRGGGHTMLEFQVGGRWIVLSPSDDAFVWRTRAGRPATLDEIRADSSIFAQIFEPFPSYPYDFRHTSHIRWAKLPGLVRGFFRLILGERGYERALTPRLYDEPRKLFLLASLAATLGFSLAAVLAKSPGARRLSTPSPRGPSDAR